MQFFVPDIRLASELGAQTSQQDKFGGLPWGLESRLWPKCSECGKSQSFLAQLLHDPVRFNLGRQGRMLYVFQCNHDPGMCATWEGGSGANACFIVEPEDVTERLSECPSDGPLVENEVRVVRWVEREDGIPASLVPSFYDNDKLNALVAEGVHKVPSSTKLASVPHWIQSPTEAPQEPGWKFVGQIDSVHSFLQAPTQSASWVYPDKEQWEGRTHCGQSFNFGDGGIAYLFVRDTDSRPKGWFFWQCG